MTRIWAPLLLLSAIFLTLIWGIWDERRVPKEDQHVNIVTFERREHVLPAPDFQFETLDGRRILLSELDHRLILLNFWASWCAPCVAEFPSLVQLAKTYPEEIALIALSVDEVPENAIHFLKRMNLSTLDAQNILIGLDQNKDISQGLFQTTMYPETFIINAERKVIYQIAGGIDWMGAGMIGFIEENK